MIELPDDKGLVCAFLLRPDCPAVSLDWKALSFVAGDDNSLLWLHFNLTDARARQWLSSWKHLPPAALDTLLATDPHMRMETFGHGIAGVLGDLYYDFVDAGEGLGLLRFYLDDRYVITGRRHPLKSVENLRQDLLNRLRLDGAAHFIVHLLKHLAEAFAAAVAELVETTDGLEDRVLSTRFRDEGAELVRIRRVMTRLRRHIEAERRALLAVLPHLPGWWSETDRGRLQKELERLDVIAQDLQFTYDRARLLQEEIAGRISVSTNRNLYFLSIVTTIFLPITLITGIFGMNVGGLPWLENSLGFLWVLLGMAVTAGVAIAVLHWRKIL